MVIIPNTLELTSMWVTRGHVGGRRGPPGLSLETDFLPIPFFPTAAWSRSSCSRRVIGHAGRGYRTRRSP